MDAEYRINPITVEYWPKNEAGWSNWPETWGGDGLDESLDVENMYITYDTPPDERPTFDDSDDMDPWPVW